MTSTSAPCSAKQILTLWLVLLAIAISLVIPSHFSAALDMVKLQAAFRRMGGNPQLFVGWEKLVQENLELPIADKLLAVNRFFNRNIEFVTDQEVWGQADYWATPMELLSKGRGDCEDYVIAKYFSLLNLNVPNDKLRLIYVKAQMTEASGTTLQAHMVLAYYPSPFAEPLLLDNLVADILPASRRVDLQPVFSFNSAGIFNGVGANAGIGQGSVGRYTRWQDLLQRAHEEGFD